MRTARFGYKESGRNAIQDSLFKNPDREFRKQRFKDRHIADRRRRDTARLPSEYDPDTVVGDEEMAGVVNLGYLKPGSNGQVDQQFEGDIQIGGITHEVKNGRLRIVSDDVLESEIGPILERHKYNQAIVSLCLLDPSDKIARFILGAEVFAKLPADARPSSLANYNTRSDAYAQGLTDLEKVVRNNSIIIDSERVYSYLNAGRLSSDAVMA